MATNYIQPGKVMKFTAPSGGVVSGTAYLIGALLVVATGTVAEGLPFEGDTEGVFTLPKAEGETWDEGELLFWDDAEGELTTESSGNRPVGCAAAAAGSDDTSGDARLSGVGSPAAAIET